MSRTNSTKSAPLEGEFRIVEEATVASR